MAARPRYRRDDLVGVNEIAKYVGVASIAVQKWKQRYSDFPQKAKAVKADIFLVRWGEVRDWLVKTGRL